MPDNDWISRAAAIDALTDTNLKRNVDSLCDGDMNRTRRAAQRVIKQLPAADAAPVVRCKDCWKCGYDNCPMNDYFDIHPMDSDFYCAAGETEDKRPRCECGPDYCDIGGDEH